MKAVCPANSGLLTAEDILSLTQIPSGDDFIIHPFMEA
jgi:hypothetical protein